MENDGKWRKSKRHLEEVKRVMESDEKKRQGV